MSKINKTIKYNLIFGLIILAILTLGVLTLLPREAKAYHDGDVTANHYEWGYNGVEEEVDVDSEDPTNGPINYGVTYSSTSTTRTNNTSPVYRSTSSTSNQSTRTNTSNAEIEEKDNEEEEERGEDGGALAASVILGENSFMPSGIIQWVVFAILVLLIVIFVRNTFGLRDNYHNSPLKHA